VQLIDAVLKLEVTPQITAEARCFMDVLVEKYADDNGIPAFREFLLNTSRRKPGDVADGGTS